MKRRSFLQGLIGSAACLFGSVAVAPPAPVKKAPALTGVDLADGSDKSGFAISISNPSNDDSLYRSVIMNSRQHGKSTILYRNLDRYPIGNKF